MYIKSREANNMHQDRWPSLAEGEAKHLTSSLPNIHPANKQPTLGLGMSGVFHLNQEWTVTKAIKLYLGHAIKTAFSVGYLQVRQ